MNRTLEIHAWLRAALLAATFGLMALLVLLMHIHAGDVAYIAHTHRPIIILPTGGPTVLSA